MAVVKNLMVRCGADFSGLTKATKKAQTSMGSLQKSVTAMQGVISTFKRVLGTAAIIQFGKSCIDAASDLQEVQNVVDVTFGALSGEVNQFAKAAIESFGLSETSAKQYAGTMGAMLKSMGLSTDAATEMSTALAGLAGDMASFYNLSADVAFQKIRSGISGESEPLKQLGVNMSVANLEAYALSQGITKSYKSMTQSEQAMLRYNYLMSVTADAQGDFAATSKSWANQTRILAERFNQLKTALGAGMIQVLTPVLNIINVLMARLVTLANAFNTITAALFGKQTAVVTANAEAVEEAADAQSSLASGITAAGKAAKGVLAGFDDLNVLQSADSSTSSGTSGESAAGISFSTETVEAPEVDTSDAEDGLLGLKSALDKLKSIDLSNIKEALEGLKEALEPFKEGVGERLRWLWDNVLVPFAGWTIGTIIPDFLTLLANVLWVIQAVVDALKPLGRWLWDSFLQPIAEWTGGVIVSVIEDLSDGLKKVSDWIRENQALVEAIVIVVGSFAAAVILANAVVGIWNAVSGVATAVTTAFGVAVKFLTSPIGIVVTVVGVLIAVITLLAKNWDKVKAVAASCWEGIKNVWSVVSGWFKTKIIEPVAKFFTGLWDGISGAAKGAWEAIKNVFRTIAGWFDKYIIQPISNAFKGFINGILSFVESFVNFFIRGINKIIGALNKISIDIPEWVPLIGGKTFGFAIPEITPLSLPRLATGGIVDGTTMAMIGEAGREAVLPLENNTGWMDALAERLGGDIVINASGEAGLLRYLNLKLGKESARRGKSLIVGGAI